MLMGLGFGGLMMNSALAIVVYFALPTLWSVLGATIHGLRMSPRGSTSTPRPRR